jgi:hypothetical protein
MIKRTLIIIILLVIVLSASGCSKYIHSAVQIPLYFEGHESYQVAIAVDYFGKKHIARTECPIGTIDNCRLIYTTVINGQPLNVFSMIPLAGENYLDPDIVVTDSGIAFIVWRWYNRGGNAKYEDWWLRSDDIGNHYRINPAYDSAGPPKLAKHFEYVYVGYEVVNGILGGSALRFRELNPLDSHTGWVADHTINEFRKTNIHLAVSGDGWLFITFLYNGYYIYSTNYGLPGDMTIVQLVINPIPTITHGVHVDVNGSPGTAYMVAVGKVTPGPGVSDQLYIAHCPIASCSGSNYITEVVPLSGTDQWDIIGEPDIVSDINALLPGNERAYVSFLARNNTTGSHSDVFSAYYEEGSPSIVSTPTNLSNTPSDEETEPSIGLMWSIFAVAGWREDLGSGNFGNVYEFDNLDYLLRTVRSSSSGKAGYDMACNADWGSGIWNELTNGRIIPWVAFNTIPAFLPMIKK